MSPDAAEILESAKQLEHDQIAALVHELLGVLEEDEGGTDLEAVQSAWEAEFRRRVDEIRTGAVELVDGQETLALAREDLAARRA